MKCKKGNKAMENEFENTPRKDRVIVALDTSRSEALHVANMLKGHASWVKVGMTLFYEAGPEIVREFKDLGFKVFLDLKFHDIPHQVEGAAYSATMSGADMLTMHTIGGADMMRAAQRGAERAAADLVSNQASNQVFEQTSKPPITLGITVLTSINNETLRQTGVERAMQDQVKELAKQAQQAGISGVVASPLEASVLREVLGSAAYIVTPGVRPAGSDTGDQSRVASPVQAFENGASHIVIGRPITQAESPADAFDAIAASL